MKNIIRKGSVIALAAALAAGGISIGQAFAAVGIDVDAECSIDFSVNTDSFTDLDTDMIPVSMYRLAAVDIGGRYTAVSGFESLKVSDASSESTAQFWNEMAEAAFDIAKDKEADADNRLENGFADEIGNLDTGLYLVVPGNLDASGDELNDIYDYGTVQTIEHVYEFTPYVVALPFNYYYSTENDEWVYDLDSALKAGQHDRLGSVTLTKELSAFDETLQNGTFSFDITAVKNGSTVYKNTAGFTFTGAGKQSVVLNGIPIGATVSIRETNSGSYNPAAVEDFILGENEETVTIVNDEAIAVNSPSDKLIQGDGVVNHYTYSKDGFSAYQNEKTEGTVYNIEVKAEDEAESE